MGRQQNRQRQRRVQRRQEQRRQQERPRSDGLGFNRVAAILAAVVVLAAIGLFAYGATRPSSTPGAAATPTSVVASSPPVKGVQCNAMENLAYHIHQHIALYDHGKHVQLPSYVGIPGGYAAAQCYYWIHVHPETPNIIHVESPIKKIFPLGDMFAIWKQTQSSTDPPGDAYVLKLEAAAKQGQVTTFVNGKRWNGSYASVPLRPHAVITVEIGKPIVAPKPFTNWGNL